MIFSFSAIQPQVCNKTVSVIVRCNSIGNISVSSDKIISNFISNQLINCYVMPVMLFDRNHNHKKLRLDDFSDMCDPEDMGRQRNEMSDYVNI